MCAVRLDSEQVDWLTDALLSEQRVLHAATAAVAEQASPRWLLGFLFRGRPDIVKPLQAAQASLDDAFARWASVDRDVAQLELTALRGQAVTLHGFVTLRQAAGDDRWPQLHERAIAALTGFYFGEDRPDSGLVAETQLAWTVMQTMGGRLLPMPYPRVRKERLEKAGQRYRELWDEWAAAQQGLPT